jgi:predicted phage terminase large subunit-like protein
MYQQRPGRGLRSTWPDAYFGPHLWTETFPRVFDAAALAVDPSKGGVRGDYSAIVFTGLSGGLAWIDASIERRPPERTVSDAIDMALRYAPHLVAVEANAFQFLLAPEFDRQCRERRVPPLPLQLVEQHGSKEMRIARLGSYLLREKVRLRDTPGSRLLVQQLRDFPLADHDDGPDALELAMRMLFFLVSGGRNEPEMGFEFARA